LIFYRSQADLKILEEKTDIEKAILELENASRGWFQDEEDFIALCKQEEKEAKAKYALKLKNTPSNTVKKATATGTSKPKYNVSSNATAWTSVIGKGSSSSGPVKKQSAMSGFSAAFDDDSD
jgi:hypothetical protein